ncbi:uncharacterized protein BDZ83DRAFT_114050 [Colletotrichum acutatum]|uniref:Uncharacterized protein n=1 Tax=Glomerella acutata TaxID=27357 RepID=A0AAD8UVK6_GLOAC|nr:uncharacterized protein BDZ83DRAFT_114050 [Colletotrichum acutatum]KAK1728603.1 hypothetical protein BDZ83DRAFT_114050 [Colletotrichum acutatum]
MGQNHLIHSSDQWPQISAKSRVSATFCGNSVLVLPLLLQATGCPHHPAPAHFGSCATGPHPGTNRWTSMAKHESAASSPRLAPLRSTGGIAMMGFAQYLPDSGTLPCCV